MTFKKVNISDPGTTTRHGADDQDKIAAYLNGENLTEFVGPIDTDTIFKSNKLIFRDLSNTVNIHIITSEEDIPGSITIPKLDGDVTMLLDNDSRLYDPRIPLTHSITHTAGQADEINLDQLGIPDDNTLLNATVDTHGLMPKLPADGLLYLDGNGNYTAPSGTGIINDGSITGAKLADDSITADKIAPAAITADRIAVAAAIPYSKLLLTGTITPADLAAAFSLPWASVSKVGSKLKDMADVSVVGRGDQMLIKWDSATSKYVFFTPAAGTSTATPTDDSVSTIKIQNLAVTTAKIALLNVTTALIADANVTLAKMAANSVDSSKIVDGSIVNADINSAAAIAWLKVSKSGSVLAE